MKVTNESSRPLTVHGKGRNRVVFIPGVAMDLNDADKQTCADSPGFARWVESGLLVLEEKAPPRRRRAAAAPPSEEQ